MSNESKDDMTDNKVLSVSQLNHQVKALLEGSFASLWVEGEVSNFSCPSSGHWYFSLKDERSQVRCAMFRGHNSRVKFIPNNGMQLRIYARVSLYLGRGDYQLLIEHIEEIGRGGLQRAFEQLKKKLSDEGLFDRQHKKSLPPMAKSLGLITSATGAAIHDILRVLYDRYPLLSVIVYPVLVQGEEAAGEIVNAISIANQRQECDVLIIARGGGSLEDLWAFNEEKVARAIFSSKLPIISAIGHEIDFTISDFVSDHRAATPSAAAEQVSPSQQELMQRLDNYEQAIIYQQKYLQQQLQQKITYFEQRLKQQHPETYLLSQRQLLTRLSQSLEQAKQRLLEQQQSHLSALAKTLHALSPLATLGRGYAIASRLVNNKRHIIDSVDDLAVQDKIQVKLKQGEVDCTVDSKQDGKSSLT